MFQYNAFFSFAKKCFALFWILVHSQKDVDTRFGFKQTSRKRANPEKGQERGWFHPIKSNPKKHLRIERLTLQCIGGRQWWYNLILFSERESECLDLKECWPRRQHVANVMRIFGEKHGWSVTWRARKGERSQSCGAYKKRNSDPAAELPEQVEVGQEERKLEKDSFTNLVI